MDAGDRRTRLGVRAVGRQLVPVTERLLGVPRADSAGQVCLGGHHVVPPADRRLQQRVVAGLEVDIDDARLEVERPHGVTHVSVRVAYGQVVLEVSAAPAPDFSLATFVDELPGQFEVAAFAGEPVELDECGLDLGVSVDAGVAVAQEHLDEVVGEAPGDREEPFVAAYPGAGNRRLDQVAGAVHLVAVLQLGVALGRLDHLVVGVEVAVVALRGEEEFGRLGDEVEQVVVADPPGLPGHRLELLVEVGVGEPRTAELDLAGAAGEPEVVEVARLFELLQAERNAGVAVDLLPAGQRPAGELHVVHAERPMHRTGVRGGHRRAAGLIGRGRDAGTHRTPREAGRGPAGRNRISRT